MKRYTLARAKISDKIYFHEDDIEQLSAQQLSVEAFTYNLGDRFYSTMEYDEETGWCSVPSGSWYKLNILELEDNRTSFERQDWSFKGKLRQVQQRVVDRFVTPDKTFSGLIQAGCGWGKTFAGTYIVGTSQKPTLVICHTKLLAYQWLDELKKLLDSADIGFIGDGKESIKPITVAIYKSLLTRLDKIQNYFEIVIVDEAHLCPADTFSKVVNGVSAKTKIALTATPWRKDGLHVILPDYFGPNRVIAEETSKLVPSVQIIKTSVPFLIRNPNRDWTAQLTKLTTNTRYLELIASTAIEKIAQGRCLLIVSERINMLEQLQALIPRSVMLVGATKNRDDILTGAGTRYDAILSTKIFDEGISCHRLDTLLLTTPSNNPAKLEQRIGRIQREHPEKKSPLVVDFWLSGAIVQAQQRSRSEWYVRKNFPILS